MLAYHPDFGQPVSYHFETIPDDPDTQVKIAVHRVIQMAIEDCSKPIIRQKAAEALQAGNGDPVQGVWRSIKPHIKFRQDTDIARDLHVDDIRKWDPVETFIPPASQAQLISTRGRGVEDCDGFSTYGACLMLALDIPVTVCTVAAERQRPWLYSHIYLVAYPNGVRVPMDLSHGPYPGWECPNLGRKREWVVCERTVQPSVILPLLLATAAGGYLAWRESR